MPNFKAKNIDNEYATFRRTRDFQEHESHAETGNGTDGF